MVSLRAICRLGPLACECLRVRAWQQLRASARLPRRGLAGDDRRGGDGDGEDTEWQSERLSRSLHVDAQYNGSPQTAIWSPLGAVEREYRRLTRTMRDQARQGRPEEALATLQRIDALGVGRDEHVNNALMTLLGRAGRWREALRVLDTMECARTEHHFAYLIALLARHSRSIEAEALYERMRHECAPEKVASIVVQNSRLLAATHARDVSLARTVMRDMQALSLAPNIITLNTLLHLHCTLGDIKRAMRLFERMVESGAVPPDATSYNTLISAHANAGELAQALRLFARMIGAPETEHGSVAELVRRAVRHAQSDAAYTPGRRAGERVLRPSVHTYSALIGAFTRSGALDGAVEVLEALRAQRGVYLNVYVYNTLLGALAARGRLADAEALLALMRGDGVAPDAVSYNAHMSGCARHRGAEAAARVFEDMCQRGVQPSEVSYFVLAAAKYEEGDAHGARETLRAMTASNVVEDGGGERFVRLRECIAHWESTGELPSLRPQRRR